MRPRAATLVRDLNKQPRPRREQRQRRSTRGCSTRDFSRIATQFSALPTFDTGIASSSEASKQVVDWKAAERCDSATYNPSTVFNILLSDEQLNTIRTLHIPPQSPIRIAPDIANCLNELVIDHHIVFEGDGSPPQAVEVHAQCSTSEVYDSSAEQPRQGNSDLLSSIQSDLRSNNSELDVAGSCKDDRTKDLNPGVIHHDEAYFSSALPSIQESSSAATPRTVMSSPSDLLLDDWVCAVPDDWTLAEACDNLVSQEKPAARTMLVTNPSDSNEDAWVWF